MKGIIFDLDGTLIDSMGVWESLGDSFLRSCGIIPPENLMEITKPLGLEETIRYFIDKLGVKKSEKEIKKEFFGAVVEQYRTTIPFKPFAREFLEQSKARGIKMCVATASAPNLIHECIQRLHLLDYVEFVLTCEEVGAGKSKPDIFLLAAKRLGLPIGEITVFEDGLTPAVTAIKAGFPVIGIADASAANEKERLQALCSRYVSSFQELL